MKINFKDEIDSWKVDFNGGKNRVAIVVFTLKRFYQSRSQRGKDVPVKADSGNRLLPIPGTNFCTVAGPCELWRPAREHQRLHELPSGPHPSSPMPKPLYTKYNFSLKFFKALFQKAILIKSFLGFFKTSI